MKTLLLGLGAVVLSLVCANPSQADHRSHYHGEYGGYYTPGYHGRYDVHGRHSSRYGHIDYSPGHYDRHGNHYHYVPSHYDYHYRGRRYQVSPSPWGWSASPWSHRRD